MAMPRKQMMGQRFGRLVVIEHVTRGKEAHWRCKCDCGTECVVRGGRLRSGTSLSCGCLGRENHLKAIVTHGMTNTRLYNIWHGIKLRTLNPSSKDWPNYGGRGITICERWRNDFAAFATDMGQPPSTRHTIERRNNHLGYSPDNCEWAIPKQQGRNKRNNHLVTYRGRVMPLSEACELAGAGIEWHRARNRIEKMGWPTALAVEFADDGRSIKRPR